MKKWANRISLLLAGALIASLIWGGVFLWYRFQFYTGFVIEGNADASVGARLYAIHHSGTNTSERDFNFMCYKMVQSGKDRIELLWEAYPFTRRAGLFEVDYNRALGFLTAHTNVWNWKMPNNALDHYDSFADE